MNGWRGVRPFTRHSLVLLVAGLVHMAIGTAYIFAGPAPSRQRALNYALEVMPIQGWGAVFFICGLLVVISSRWPPRIEKWGYTILTGLASGWGTFYLLGSIFTAAHISNITAALLWGLVAFMWWAISGLINPHTALAVADGSS